MTISPFWGNVFGIITLVSMIAFLAIWAWLWLPQHKAKFDRLARLPMQDDEDDTP